MHETIHAAAALAAQVQAVNSIAEHCDAPHFTWQFECVGPDGRVKWTETIRNLVTTAGKNDLLDKYFAGSSYTAAWYMGLVDNASFSAFAAGDTMSSHAGWIENTAYSAGTRPAMSFSAASGGSKATSSACSFAISGASGGTDDIKGAFVVTNSTKGGTTGVLYSAGAFSAVRTVNDGDTLNVSATLSA